jgi:YgiT-type zinc finger domain-containing protein
MKCVNCKQGETNAGRTSVVIKDVPADSCNTCDEYYVSELITRRVLELGEPALAQGVEIEVLRFAA